MSNPAKPVAPGPLATDGRRGIPMGVRVTLSALVYPEDGGGYSAEVPALPGCFTEGETLEEVRANLVEAAEGWLMAKHDLVMAGPGRAP